MDEVPIMPGLDGPHRPSSGSERMMDICGGEIEEEVIFARLSDKFNGVMDQGLFHCPVVEPEMGRPGTPDILQAELLREPADFLRPAINKRILQMVVQHPMVLHIDERRMAVKYRHDAE